MNVIGLHVFVRFNVCCGDQVSNKKFCGLGLNPVTLEQGLLEEVVDVATKYKHRCDTAKVMPSSFWNKNRALESSSSSIAASAPIL